MPELVNRENLRWIGELFGIRVPHNVRQLDLQPIQPVLEVGAFAANAHGFFYEFVDTVSAPTGSVDRIAITREELFAGGTPPGAALRNMLEARDMRSSNTDVWLTDCWATLDQDDTANFDVCKIGYQPTAGATSNGTNDGHVIYHVNHHPFETAALLAAGDQTDLIFQNPGADSNHSGLGIVGRKLPIFLPPSTTPSVPTRLLAVVEANGSGAAQVRCHFQLWLATHGCPPPAR